MQNCKLRYDPFCAILEIFHIHLISFKYKHDRYWCLVKSWAENDQNSDLRPYAGRGNTFLAILVLAEYGSGATKYNQEVGPLSEHFGSTTILKSWLCNFQASNLLPLKRDINCIPEFTFEFFKPSLFWEPFRILQKGPFFVGTKQQA